MKTKFGELCPEKKKNVDTQIGELWPGYFYHHLAFNIIQSSKKTPI